MLVSATDVFVSYKAEDRARLKPLVEALEAEGFSVWWDAHIGGGTNWHEDIERHLDAAKCVIVAWSKRSIGHDGHFVRDEARRAQRREAYVPVCLDAVEPPLGFGEVQAISIKGWKGDRSDPRFVAVISAVRERVTGERSAHHPAHPGRLGLSRRTMIAGGAGIGAVAITGGGWALLRSGSSAASPNSIAVLPFANHSGDPAKAYFSEGVADEIRSALARIAGVTVIGRTSSEAVRNDDARTAAKKLGVGNILTGSVRQSPSTIRISAELIDGQNGTDRWSQDYDRSPGDTILIQTDIAQNVASALSATLGNVARAAIALGGTSNTAAQDLYLRAKAKYQSDDSEDGLRADISLLNAALVLDPRFARAYALKALVMTFLAENSTRTGSQFQPAFVAAEAVARQATAITPDLDQGHRALAAVRIAQLDIGRAAPELEKARSLPNSDASDLRNYANFLGLMGKADQSIDVAKQAISRDPLDPLTYQTEGFVLLYARRYDEAVAAFRRAMSLAPKLSIIHFGLALGLMKSGRNEEALAEVDKLPPENDNRLYLEAFIFARQGNRSASDAALHRLQNMDGETNNMGYAEIYADRGDSERSFAFLDRAWIARDPGLIRLKIDPLFDRMRSDPRFIALLKKMNFPS